MESVKRYRFKGAAGEYVYASDFDNAARCFLDAAERCLAAERREQALQQRLTVQDQRVDELVRDKARLDALESNCWDVRFDSSPNGDAGDSSVSIEIVGHWMDKPSERVIGENYSENLRDAIDQAMKAPAYPPARPEYPEIDEALEATAIQ